MVCAASFLCNMILDGIAYCFGVLITPLCDYFDSDKGTVSWVGSLLCGVYLMSGPVVGGLVNKYGCRPVCIAGDGILTHSDVTKKLFRKHHCLLRLLLVCLRGECADVDAPLRCYRGLRHRSDLPACRYIHRLDTHLQPNS